MPVILWTDALIFLLLVTIIFLLIGLRHQPHIQEQWRKAYAHPTRMIALIILLAYVSIGLLDCLHYKTAHDADVHSVLDWLLLPQSAQNETTYSAPFATKAFSKQMQIASDGSIAWISPKLIYAHKTNIPIKILHGLARGLSFWLFASALYWFVFVKYYKIHFAPTTPWRTGWLTIGLVFAVYFICLSLWDNYHILGTDKVGTDVFYSALKSIRTGLIIGTVTTFVTLPFAIILGAMAGYFRGWVDDVIQYIYTTVSSVPGVLLIAAAVLSLDAVMERHTSWLPSMAQRMDMRLLLLCCILGLTSWTTLCRIIRGETLKLREQEFILASKVLGANSWQIIKRHIVPNLMHIILISLVLDFSGLVLAEAVLSYVGVGVDPSSYSWGIMINSARMELGRDPIIWWSLTGAFVLMFVLVLAANIFADGVRDAFDPKVS